MSNFSANNNSDIKISVKQTNPINSDMEIDAFSEQNELVPKIDQNYKFDRDTILRFYLGLHLIKEF